MKPYSEDLRRRIVAAVEGGMSKSEAARVFDVSLSSVKRYLRFAARQGSHPPQGRRKTSEGERRHRREPARRRREQASICRRLGADRLPEECKRGEALRIYREEATPQARVLPKNGAWVRARGTSF